MSNAQHTNILDANTTKQELLFLEFCTIHKMQLYASELQDKRLVKLSYFTLFFAIDSIPSGNPQHANHKRKYKKRGTKDSYTNSYTRNQLSEVGRKDFQKWNGSAQKADFAIAGSIKFENLIAGSCKTVIHIVIQKSCQNTKKPQQKRLYCGFVVVSPGIEPGTQGFSVLCSTN